MSDDASVIADIFPDLKTWFPELEAASEIADPESARFRLLDSTSTFLGKTGVAVKPMMLILDDIHWADTPTLQLLQFLARYISESRIVVVGTYRDTELSRRHPLSETLADLNRERNYSRHLLRGLGDDEIRRLIEELGNAPSSAETAAKIATQTQGNPFFIREIAYELADETQPGLEMRIPEGVREVVGKRLNRISERCQRRARKRRRHWA